MTISDSPIEEQEPTSVVKAFDHIHHDIRHLMGLFKEVLLDAKQPHLADLLPWLGEGAGVAAMPDTPSDDETQCLSICFQLLNMVEEVAAIRAKRDHIRAAGPDAVQGLWDEQFAAFKARGLSPDEALAAIERLRIEPVLTAHPTEAKRPLILEIHRRLYALIHERESHSESAAKQASIDGQIKALLEGLWRSGEIFTHKPTVSDELENTLYYLSGVFPSVLPQLDGVLRTAWQKHFGDVPLTAYPQFSFGTWVGGDRDGHPFVTAEVTQNTLHRLGQEARTLQRDGMLALGQAIPLNARICPLPPVLQDKLDHELSLLRGALRDQYGNDEQQEPWRLLVTLWAERCAWEHPHAYREPTQLYGELNTLTEGLKEVGAHAIIDQMVGPMQRQLEVFGFHLAVLDVRQNSAFHDNAMAAILSTAGVDDGENWTDWPEAKRVAWLNEELKTQRPLLSPSAKLSDEAQAVIDCYRVLGKYAAKRGRQGIGSLIVSMTRQLSDLLSVYIMARETRLVMSDSDTLAIAMPVVPLLETIEDLNQAPDLLDQFLSHPVTRAGINARKGRNLQQVMIGYSDSNKDGGFLSSQWHLQIAQRAIAEVGRKHDTEIAFFHGRGGTPGRGAGPTHRFLEALPRWTFSGCLRMTEQGETIAQKYANADTAVYELEQISAGAFGALVRPNDPHPRREELHTIFNDIVEESQRTYRAFVEDPDFMTYWTAATPIDAIESSSIGSRPARRTGKRSLEDLRAIPWVFSWNQSRHYLPAWYGVGSALANLKSRDPEAWSLLKHHSHTWSFLRYCLYNAETALTSADLSLVEAYAGLVENIPVRDRFLNRIKEECQMTGPLIDELFSKARTERRPRMIRTHDVRKKALFTLHAKQINLIKHWRDLRKAGDDAKADELLPLVLLSINAVASGLRTTG